MMICTNKELILKNVTFDMSTNIGHYSNITVAHLNTICMAADWFISSQFIREYC